MAIDFISVTSTISANGTSITASLPSGINSSSLLIAYLVVYDTATIPTAPVGWTEITTARAGSALKTYNYVWYRVGNAAIGNWTTPNVYKCLTILAYSDVDTTTPIDTTSTGNSANTNTRIGLSVTTATNNARLLMLSSGYDHATATPSGMTQRIQLDIVVYAWDQLIVTAGSTGNRSSGGSTDFWAASMVALRPVVSIIPITPSVISAANTLYAPILRQRVAVAHIANTSLFYNPAIYLAVQTAYIPQTNVLYAPTVKLHVVANLVDNTSVLYAPTAQLQVNATLIVNENTVYELLVALTLTAPIIENTSVFYSTAISGIETLNVPFSSNTNALYTPTVTQHISAAFISSASIIYTGTAILQVTNAFTTESNAVYEPVVNLTVASAFIGSANVLYQPTVSAYIAIVVPILETTNVLYQPNLKNDLVMLVPFVSDQNTFYALVITQGVNPAIITSDVVIYPALVAQHIGVALIPSTEVIYRPLVTNALILSTPFYQNVAIIYSLSLTFPASDALYRNIATIEYFVSVSDSTIPNNVDTVTLVHTNYAEL